MGDIKSYPGINNHAIPSPRIKFIPELNFVVRETVINLCYLSDSLILIPMFLTLCYENTKFTENSFVVIHIPASNF